jgi:hypothetical protein
VEASLCRKDCRAGGGGDAVMMALEKRTSPALIPDEHPPVGRLSSGHLRRTYPQSDERPGGRRPRAWIRSPCYARRGPRRSLQGARRRALADPDACTICVFLAAVRSGWKSLGVWCGGETKLVRSQSQLRIRETDLTYAFMLCPTWTNGDFNRHVQERSISTRSGSTARS